jgi:hypothetical protein
MSERLFPPQGSSVVGQSSFSSQLGRSSRVWTQDATWIIKLLHGPPSRLATARGQTFSHAKANQFWYGFETAMYLLRIGLTGLGWTTFHTCRGTAVDNLPQPITLLQKVITTFYPHGGLRRLREVSYSARDEAWHDPPCPNLLPHFA